MDNKFTPEIYRKLLKAVEELPKEAIEFADKNITKKGYDMFGYGYQFMVNVLNEVVGPADWSFNYEIVKETNGQWANGRPFWELTIATEITILGVTKKCVGGHKAESYTDALKGGITNAFKKTLGFFGVGKKAYEGTVDDDYRAVNGLGNISNNVPTGSTLNFEINRLSNVSNVPSVNNIKEAIIPGVIIPSANITRASLNLPINSEWWRRAFIPDSECPHCHNGSMLISKYSEKDVWCPNCKLKGKNANSVHIGAPSELPAQKQPSTPAVSNTETDEILTMDEAFPNFG